MSKVKKLQEIEVEINQIILRENDILDTSRLNKGYLDYERDTETEYMRKIKSLKNTEQDYQIIALLQNEGLNDIA